MQCSEISEQKYVENDNHCLASHKLHGQIVTLLPQISFCSYVVKICIAVYMCIFHMYSMVYTEVEVK